jgi:uncharacterized protein (TIGR00730 family)
MHYNRALLPSMLLYSGLTMLKICIFCGSNTGKDDHYIDATRTLVRALAAAQVKIIFGGGKVGLMGVVAEAALAAGAHITGVTPRRLLEHELVHEGLTELRVCDSMHERKVDMTRLADAFIVLPGGMGTYDELFEVLTLNQLGVHEKPVALYNIGGYYDRLMTFLDHAVNEQFVRAEHRDMLIVEHEPAALLRLLQDWRMPQVSKWMTNRR